MLAHLFIAALLMQQPVSPADPKTNSAKLSSESSIYTFPLIAFLVGMFLLQCGKQSQFPFYVPFSESIGLVGYEPASILLIMNILDIIFRPIGGYLSSTKTPFFSSSVVGPKLIFPVVRKLCTSGIVDSNSDNLKNGVKVGS